MNAALNEIFTRMEKGERMTMEKAQQIYKAHQGEGMFITEEQFKQRMENPRNLANKMKAIRDANKARETFPAQISGTDAGHKEG